VVHQAYDPSGETDVLSVAGWHGQIWTSDLHLSAIARVDPATGRVVKTVPVAVHAALLAVGGDTMWISEGDTRRNEPLVRFDLRTKKVVATIPHLGEVFAILPTPDGVWASLWDTSEVVRINPVTNRVMARYKAGTNPQALAFGDGSLWVANGFGHYLTRLDPATGRIQAVIQLDRHGNARDDGYNCNCQSVTVDARGVWAIAHDNRSLVRIDPQTNRVTSSLTLAKAPSGTPMQPYDVLSADGSLWEAAGT
jgi:virginiamycin B lyase